MIDEHVPEVRTRRSQTLQLIEAAAPSLIEKRPYSLSRQVGWKEAERLTMILTMLASKRCLLHRYDAPVRWWTEDRDMVAIQQAPFET
jgi:hypothetical protein